MIRHTTFRLDGSKADKYQITSQGFLLSDAYVTRSGVFDYVDEAGKVVREYRSPEEVFSQASMDSLKMVPLTLLHPKEAVTVENVKKYQIGSAGELVFRDNDLLGVRVQIIDKDAIKTILERHRHGKAVELSCGYDAEVIPMPGEHPTEGHYDAVQKNIRYNHISIVDMGRAGANVKLKLDKKEENTVFKLIKNAIRLDGFSMDAINEEAPKEAKGLIERLAGKLDDAITLIIGQAAKIKELVTKADQAQAKADALTEENTRLKAEKADFSNPSGTVIQQLIKDRMSIEAVAKGAEIKTDGMDNQAIKIAVIQKASPEFKADGKSDDYINARYDSVVESIDAARKDGNNALLALFVKTAKTDTGTQKKDHRQEFIKKSQNMHTEEKKTE